MKSVILVTSTCLALVSIGAACGSSGDSTFIPGTADTKISGSSGDDGSGSSSGLGPIGSSGGGTSSTSSGGPVTIEDGGACAAKTADAQRKPAYLFFILDQSASMAAPACSFDFPGPCYEPDGKPVANPPACCTEEELPKRWVPITKALDAFVNDPLSKGITAGLELFPSQAKDFCDVATYAADVTKMDVPLTDLPDPTKTTFSSKFVKEPSFLGTPTRAVFQAMGPIAVKWAADHPDAKTAIVLLTDGLPQQCGATDDDIDNVAGELSKIADKVPTYVIGVSDDPDNLKDLQKLSDAGKTTLTRVDTADPAKTQKQFLDRINEIRKSTLSCDVTLPAPPDGLTLDMNKVNVTFTTGKGEKQPLTYDEKCTGTGKSWHFDSLTNPTKISLCAATCDVFEADPDGVVGVEFGCARRDDTVVK